MAVGAFADPNFPAPRVSVWEEFMHPWVGLPDGIEHFFFSAELLWVHFFRADAHRGTPTYPRRAPYPRGERTVA